MDQSDRRMDNENRERLEQIHSDYIRFARLSGLAHIVQAAVLILSLALSGRLL